MALLTNPNSIDGKFTKLLTNNGGVVCFIIYLSGIIWFLTLAHRSFNNATYFSENALLPGLVQGEFDEDLTAKKLYTELQGVIESNPDSIPIDWLLEKFSEMSIDAYLHNFTFYYPFIHNTSYKGQNVYGILRAPRSSSTEGLVVTAPYSTVSSGLTDNSASIAMMLALAKYCRRHKYWAKDIIFLITNHEQLGTQAWLEAYHNIQLGNGILNHGTIVGRAGSIQAAINLEFHSTKISHIDVKVEGLNGQLPNLDLANLVHRLCKNEGIRSTFKNKSHLRKKAAVYEQWYHSLSTLMSMVLTQASCVPNGNHGLYHRFGIEAVTMEGYKPPPKYRKQVSGFLQAGRVLEGVLRSLNNLLERFHQSYFFYLLTSSDRFIPIGSYMPAVSLVGIPLLIRGLTIWMKIYSLIKPKLQANKVAERGRGEGENGQKERTDDIQMSFRTIGLFLILTHVTGWLYGSSGTWLSNTGFEVAGFSAKTSIYLGFFVYFLLSVVGSSFFSFGPMEINLLNIVALLELATLLLIIAMHNFSLSLILSAVYVPCVCFVAPKSEWMKKSLKSFFMVLIHPFVLVHMIVLAYTHVTLGDESLLEKAFSATQHSFVYLVIDDMIYANWFLKAVFGFLTPCWLMFWKILHS